MKPCSPTALYAAYSPGRMPCIAIMRPLPTPGRSLSAAGSIARSGTTRCCRWRPTGGSTAVANFCAVTTGHGARKSSSGCIPSRRSSPSSASRFRTGSATTSITICCATSATTSASWWRSPTRSSHVWISTSWSARWRKRSIATSGSTPSAWCCAATAKGSSTSIPHTISMPAIRFTTRAR